MGKSWADIWAITQQRRSYDRLFLRAMIEIRDRYNNDRFTFLPDVQDEPTFQSLSPQLIQDGIEHLAMRASSQLPSVTYPSVTQTTLGERRADTRGRATYSAWYESALNLKFRRAFRHYAGYGTFCMVVMPDMQKQRAIIELRDPLTAYPELRAADDIRPPTNVAFIYGRSRDWIVKSYPEAYDYLYSEKYQKSNFRSSGQEVLWDVCEWIDEDEIVIGILGPRMDTYFSNTDSPVGPGMELRRWANKAGMVCVSIPRRITMDRVTSQMASIIPIVDWAAKLTALEVMAAESSVMPAVVAMGEPNQAPELIGGQWHDGRDGRINLTRNVKGLQVINTPPSQITGQIIDRLEQAGRFSGGILPQFGGETGGSLRTGRALDTMGSFSIDPRVAEAQDVMARGLEMVINPGILETEKGYWGQKKYVCFSGWAGDSTTVEYVPEKDFESTLNSVTYAFPGTDISQLSVALAQLNGAGIISRHTTRIKHPLVDNAANEEEKLAIETIQAAVLASVPMGLQAGSLTTIDAATILDNLEKGLTIVEAIMDANEKAQQRQATLAPPPEAGQGASPLTQPGLEGGPAGASGMAAPIGQMAGPAAQISTLRSLDRAMKTVPGSGG